MADFPLLGAQAFEAVGADAANSRGTNVQAHAVAHTKGIYAELIASTARSAHALLVLMRQNSANRAHLMDIAVGAALSEQIIAADLLVDQRDQVEVQYLLPIEIPAGTRIAARVQSSGGADQVPVSCVAVSQGFEPSSPSAVLSTYGAAAADSGGTSVDPGGTAHTKGAWTQLTASTDRQHTALLLALGGQLNGARTVCTWLLDVGIGAAGSEQVLIPDIFASSDGRNVFPTVVGPLPVSIPGGTRLAVRAQSSVIDATDRLFDIIAYGVG